jgi:hypothetical protein
VLRRSVKRCAGETPRAQRGAVRTGALTLSRVSGCRRDRSAARGRRRGRSGVSWRRTIQHASARPKECVSPLAEVMKAKIALTASPASSIVENRRLRPASAGAHKHTHIHASTDRLRRQVWIAS